MWSHSTHQKYLRQTIDLAKQSPPKPTNFRVGCVIVRFQTDDDPGTVLSTGYTLELEGNTHAEQCALIKLQNAHGVNSEYDLSDVLKQTTLYTSLEPCGKRLSGNDPCVQRICNTRKANEDAGIQRVVFGAKEPITFVEDSQSCQILSEAGIDWKYLPDFEDEIMSVATAGHESDNVNFPPSDGKPKVEVDARILAEVKRESAEAADQLEAAKEKSRMQRAVEASPPRNKYKRMMEAPPGSDESWR